MSRSCDYFVRIIDPSSQEHSLVNFKEEVANELCTSRPPDGPKKQFFADLAAKHDGELLGMRPWVCWNCEKRAGSLTHNPVSYLESENPHVVDITLPVCETEGRCDLEGKEFFADVM